MSNFKLCVVSLAIVAFVFPGGVLAVSGNANPKAVAKQGSREQAQMMTVKQKACVARERAVQKRMEQLVRMATNMKEVFTKISDRVMSYYQTKVVASGRSVSNYTDLVQAIGSKKTLVDEAITKAQTDVDAFNCTGGDPKAFMNTFRVDMQAVKTALKNYRSAVNNLIVAVKMVAPTPTAAPSATPSPNISQ